MGTQVPASAPVWSLRGPGPGPCSGGKPRRCEAPGEQSPPVPGTMLTEPTLPQNQLAACMRALESSEELLETANQTLQATDSDDFPQVGTRGWQINYSAARLICISAQE